MEIDRKELKRLAREAMGLPTPRFWAVTLVYLLMTTGLSYGLSFLVPSEASGDVSGLAFFLTVLTTLYTTVVRFGYDLWAMWTSRRLEPGLGALIQGFEIAGRVILMELMIVLRLFVWIFSLAFLVTLAVLAIPSAALLLIPAISAVSWIIMLRYALANYLLADRPADGPAAAIQRSVMLMQGWKLELFKLEFSFLGWELLNTALSTLVSVFFLQQAGFFQSVAGIGYLESLQTFQTITNGALCVGLTNLVTLPLSLWLTPYRSVARAGFYDARCKLQRDSAPQMPPL